MGDTVILSTIKKFISKLKKKKKKKVVGSGEDWPGVENHRWAPQKYKYIKWTAVS